MEVEIQEHGRSLLYAACIGLGLLFAYQDGSDLYGLIVGAMVGVGLVVALLSVQILVQLNKNSETDE
ncbi:hypothetical protein BST95_18035 [Halioglobus japonicus]|uniref:Uncharacterized protein n=1 Tax=Halioglobus japonicus TaxID=930805 RepID=A0AAP8SP14_9GAMM|nr:hypothetical protein BST95_18035 [Halioglobus japonicus]PLW87061.1 hypothetical protein C0029_00190 [Halioglobus japonicus]